jgi:hypothetical protein
MVNIDLLLHFRIDFVPYATQRSKAANEAVLNPVLLWPLECSPVSQYQNLRIATSPASMMSPDLEEVSPQPASPQGPGGQMLSLLHELHQKPKTRAPPMVTQTERWSRMIWATPKSYLQPLQAQKHSCAHQRHTVTCTGQPASSNHAKVERAAAHGSVSCITYRNHATIRHTGLASSPSKPSTFTAWALQRTRDPPG